MANKKITELDAATTLASTDVVPVVDVSEDVTKKITATNLFRTLPDGTAAAPSLSFASDAGNGVFLAGTDTVGISTGGTQRVTVDGSGNVTISGDLQVDGATTTVQSTTVTIDDKNIELGSVASPSNTTADGGGITLKGATDKTLKWINSTGCWTFNQPMNFNDHVRIDSSGNVGIGDSSPSEKLSVAGKISFIGTESAFGNSSQPTIYRSGSSSGSYPFDNFGHLIIQPRADGAARDIVFATGNTGANKTVIDSSGRVGIGITSPQNNLHLSSSAAVARFQITNSTTAEGSSDGTALIQTGNTFLINNRENDDIYFATNNSEAVRIKNSGNVGIGTSSPSNLLHVNGQARFEDFLRGHSTQNKLYIADDIALSATKKLYLDGGSNTYIHEASADNIAVVTSGSSRLRIDGSGRVWFGNGTSFNLGASDTLSLNPADGLIGFGMDGRDSYVTSTSGCYIYSGSGSSGTTLAGELILQSRSNVDRDIKFVTGSSPTQRMVVTGSGNVGIGQDTPASTLHVSGTTTARFQLSTDNTGHTSNDGVRILVDSSNNLEFLQKESANIEFFTASTERMRINSSGNVGIGTTSPGAALHIESSSADAAKLRIGFDSPRYYDIFRKSSDGTGFLHFYGSQTGFTGYVFGGVDGERMRIDSSGRVGIGATPGSQEQFLVHGGDNSIYVPFARSSTKWISLHSGGTNPAIFCDTGGSLRFGHGSARNSFTTERMRIDTSGRLLLGTTTEGEGGADNLTIADSGNCGITLRSGTSSQCNLFFSDGTSGAAEYDGYIAYNQSGRYMLFGTAQTERFRITSTGAWAIEGASNYGTSGQVLTSNGNDSPTWQSPSAGAQIVAGNSNVEVVDTGSNGHILFDTEGAERMRIDSSGRVGIGIGNPGSYYQHGDNLVVGATGASSGITIRTGNVNQGILAFADGTTGGSQQYAGYVIYDHNVNGMLFATGATERMRIDSSGRVGIGISSPEDRLDLGSGNLRFKQAIGGTGTYGSIKAFNTLANSSPATSIRFIRDVATVGNDGAICFDTTNSERARIDSSGRFGIKTSSPNFTLDVNGEAGIVEGQRLSWHDGSGGRSASIYGGSGDVLVFANTSSNTERMRLDSSGRLLLGTTTEGQASGDNFTVADSGDCGITIRSGTSSTGSIYFSDATSGGGEYDGFVDYNQSSRYMRFGTASAEQMRIDSSGRVMIGTSSNNGGFLTVDSGGVNSIVLRDNSIENHKTNGNAEIAINYHGYLSGGGQFRDFRVYNGKAGHLATFDGSSGRLGVGASATSPGGRIHIHNGSSNEFALRIDHDHSSAIFQFCEIGSSSYVGDGLKMHYTRGGNSAFNFMAMDANHGGSADREFTLRGDGNAFADGNWNSGGADYAEFFESSTGAAIPVGTTVVLDNNKVRAATAEDAASAIMGVVRPKEPGNTTASVGNTAWNRWNQKYLTDDFDRYILDEHVVYEWTEEVEDGDDIDHSYESHQIPDGITVPNDVVAQTHDSKGNRFVHYRLNPDYDPAMTYVPREERDEWVIVGLVGQVKMLGGQPVNDRWVKMRDVSDTVEQWFIR